MKHIFAPWRMQYIKHADDPGCIFCQLPEQNNDQENLIVFRGETVFAIMNRFPYNPGHLMIAPYRHIQRLAQLSPEEALEMMQLAGRLERVLQDIMKPHGFNAGINMGRPAGGGFEHLHLHIVPRWSGDTNYMPVLSDTKVVSQALDETYREIVEALKARDS